MISKRRLQFKLGETREKITPSSGLALFGEYALAVGLKEAAEKAFPAPLSGRGFKAFDYVFPLILMLHAGGRHLEDIRKIKNDPGLRKLLKLEVVPTADAIGDWLRRHGEEGVKKIEKINKALIEEWLKDGGGEGLTLDIDATLAKAEKKEAELSYKGERGYFPMLGHLKENGLILEFEFRKGNESPGSGNLEFYRKCKGMLPKGKRIKHFRADSASYQAALLDELEEDGVKYAVGADLDCAVRETIKTIKPERYVKYRDGEAADAIHIMNKSKYPFRLTAFRKFRERSLFEKDGFDYHVYATNREEESAAEVLEFYFHRGEDSENRLKELKLDFGMESLPCGQFEANALFFSIACLAYNFYKMFVRSALPKSFWRSRALTVRYHVYNIGGKIVETARALFLKVSKESLELFEEIRRRICMIRDG